MLRRPGSCTRRAGRLAAQGQDLPRRRGRDGGTSRRRQATRADSEAAPSNARTAPACRSAPASPTRSPQSAPVGSVITFRYQELTDAGVPRFPELPTHGGSHAAGPDMRHGLTVRMASLLREPLWCRLHHALHELPGRRVQTTTRLRAADGSRGWAVPSSPRKPPCRPSSPTIPWSPGERVAVEPAALGVVHAALGVLLLAEHVADGRDRFLVHPLHLARPDAGARRPAQRRWPRYRHPSCGRPACNGAP